MTDKFACVFPGQGSQSVGMVSELATTYPEIKTYFQDASAILGYDLWQLVESGPAEQLDQTQYTQPALLVASVAIYQLLAQHNAWQPQYLAGHSLGEYTALVCAGSLSFAEGLRLVAKRGLYMQEAVPLGTGAMAAIIGLSDEEVKALCAEVAHTTQQVLAPANFNSIGQVVIAGSAQAVEQALQLAKEKKAKLAIRLPVSVPSHCALMQPAAKRLAADIQALDWQMPKIPVLSNAQVQVYQDVEHIKAGLIEQLTLPVRWVESIHYFQRQGISQIIECGPGKVLSGLIKRIDKTITVQTSQDQVSVQAILDRFSSAA